MSNMDNESLSLGFIPACEPDLMPSFPQHRNKGRESAPQPEEG